MAHGHVSCRRVYEKIRRRREDEMVQCTVILYNLRRMQFCAKCILEKSDEKDIYRRHGELPDIHLALCGLVRILPFHILLE